MIKFEEIIIYNNTSIISFNSNYPFIYKENELSNKYYFSNLDFFISECRWQSLSCTNEFYKCENDWGIQSINNHCILLSGGIEEHFYDSNSNTFQNWYDFCKLRSNKKMKLDF